MCPESVIGRDAIKLNGPKNLVSRMSFSFIGTLEQVLRRNEHVGHGLGPCDTVGQ
jgi:hypothetical protein